jgi:hypothetical protein
MSDVGKKNVYCDTLSAGCSMADYHDKTHRLAASPLVTGSEYHSGVSRHHRAAAFRPKVVE